MKVSNLITYFRDLWERWRRAKVRSNIVQGSNKITYTLWERTKSHISIVQAIKQDHIRPARSERGWRQSQIQGSNKITYSLWARRHRGRAHQYCESVQRRSHTLCESSENTVESDLYCEGINVITYFRVLRERWRQVRVRSILSRD